MALERDKKIDQILEGFNHRKIEEHKPITEHHTIEDVYNRMENCEKEIESLNGKLDKIIPILGEQIARKDNNIESQRLDKSYAEVLVLLLNINTCIENDVSIDKSLVTYIQTEINRVLAKYGYRIVDFSDDTRNYYEVEYHNISEEFELVRRAIINNKDELIIEGKIYLKNND